MYHLKSKTNAYKLKMYKEIRYIHKNSPYNIKNNWYYHCSREIEREGERTNLKFLELFLHSDLHSSDRLRPVDSPLPGPRVPAGP